MTDEADAKISLTLDEIHERREMALLEGFELAYRLIHEAKNIPVPPNRYGEDGTWKLLCEIADGLTIVPTDDREENINQSSARDRATAQAVRRGFERLVEAARRRQ